MGLLLRTSRRSILPDPRNPNIKQKMVSVLTILFTILICFGAGGIEAQTGRIADDEMNALHEIAEQVGKKDWDFKQTNCDENGNWGKTTFVKPTYNNTVNCTCSSGVCHITAIATVKDVDDGRNYSWCDGRSYSYSTMVIKGFDVFDRRMGL
ncbi:unnamed protein product [Camellia sinensis]